MDKSARFPSSDIHRVTVPVSEPYNKEWVLDFLRKRALAGIEEVSNTVYRRCISRSADTPLWLSAQFERADSGWVLHIDLPKGVRKPDRIVHAVSRVFDLDSDAQSAFEVLEADAEIGELVRQKPGLRVPGAFNAFETSVRALLGQQVSVARATTLANKMIQAYGEGMFPQPWQLLDKDVAELGMPGARGSAIVEVAKRYHKLAGTSEEDLDDQSLRTWVDSLEEIKGIGPWTTNYLRLRVVKDADAFPHNDWVVLKELQTTPARALKQAEGWRPYRASALMYLWCRAGLKRTQ